jgi:hypothetical protein
MSQVWRQMLQLRWARRRVGAQVTAHKSSAHINNHAARDLAEADAAAAVIAAKQRSRQGARSFGQGQGQAGSVEAEVMELLTWLSGKQELLLLQEMWHFLSCWHSYVMDGMRVKAWERLEKVGWPGVVCAVGTRNADRCCTYSHSVSWHVVHKCYLIAAMLS